MPHPMTQPLASSEDDACRRCRQPAGTDWPERSGYCPACYEHTQELWCDAAEAADALDAAQQRATAHAGSSSAWFYDDRERKARWRLHVADTALARALYG